MCALDEYFNIVLTAISREKFHIVIIISHNAYIKKPMTVAVHDMHYAFECSQQNHTRTPGNRMEEGINFTGRFIHELKQIV